MPENQVKIEIATIELGPMENNSYLIADTEKGQAAVIDPSFESEIIVEEINRRGWAVSSIWLTHAHFDHIAGVKTLLSALGPKLVVGLHPADLSLWRQGGGGRAFGIKIEPGSDPTLHFEHEQILRLGRHYIEVRHTPGHTPGHVIFYSAAAGAAFCGDLIFYRGVGRTDLPGGEQSTLLQSIYTQILTLPPSTRLLSGHGPETTVQDEARNNPFL